MVESILVDMAQSYGFPGECWPEALWVVDEQSHYHIGILLDLLSWGKKSGIHHTMLWVECSTQKNVRCVYKDGVLASMIPIIPYNNAVKQESAFTKQVPMVKI